MATVADTVKAAMELLRVADPSEDLDPETYESVLLRLNRMMTRWEADGLQLGWTNVANPTDTMPVPDEALEAIDYNLAIRCRALFGVAVEADVVRMATDGLAALRADMLSSNYAQLTYDDLPQNRVGPDRGAFLAGY